MKTVSLIKGKCENCTFVGYLRPKDVIRPEDVSSLELTTAPIRQLMVCITCFETPAGIKSANLEHQRLPNEEYSVK